MPKIISLTNQQFEVDRGTEIDPEASEANGGQIVTREFWELIFIDTVYGDVVKLKLSPERRDELVKKLTGGVVLASVT